MTISSPILKECYAHGIETYPEEACGLISRPIEAYLENVHRTRNLMDEFHARDPEKWPRTNLNGYIIDPLEHIRLEELLKQQHHEIKIVYHSHPDLDAYFSKHDRETALPDGKLLHTGIDYLVVGIKNKKPNGAILAVFNSKKLDFDIIRIE